MTNIVEGATLSAIVVIVNDLTQDWGIEQTEPLGANTLMAADLQFTSEQAMYIRNLLLTSVDQQAFINLPSAIRTPRANAQF